MSTRSRELRPISFVRSMAAAVMSCPQASSLLLWISVFKPLATTQKMIQVTVCHGRDQNASNLVSIVVGLLVRSEEPPDMGPILQLLYSIDLLNHLLLVFLVHNSNHLLCQDNGYILIRP